MPLLRKIGFYLFLALSLGAAVWAYLRLRESKAPAASVTEHIPSDVVAAIETRQVHELVQQLTRQNLIWSSLLTEEAFSRAQKGIQYLDSLTRSSEQVSDLVEGNPVYWSFVRQGDKIEHIILFRLKEQNDAQTVKRFFDQVFKPNTSVSSFSAYDVSINGKAWLATCHNGLVYFSSDLSLLQTCIQLEKTASLAENKTYQQLLKLNGSQNTRIYLDHRHSALLNKSLFSRQSLFSLSLELNSMTGTGYTMPDSGTFLFAVAQQGESTFRQLEKLPDQAASLAGISISRAADFYERNQALLPSALAKKNEAAWKILNDSAMYDIRAELYENTESELILANYWLQEHEEQLIQLKVADEAKADEFLKLISDSSQVVQDIRTFHLRKAFGNLFSFYSASGEMPYACLSGGNIVLLSGPNMLRHYTESLAGSNTLGKNNSFMAYAADNLFEPSQYVYYENYDLIKNSSFPRLINSVELNTGDDVLSNLSLGFKRSAAGLQMRLHATHKQEPGTSTDSKDILWSFAADTSIATPVQLFSNHLTHENELCFQDQNNTLYLISTTGKALWKKTINEPIRSAIYTVDLFKNGKWQMLFNTDNYLHLVDRNGNEVQGYPVRLPQRATSAITVLDYEKTKDYRIFIACADKRLYNYSLYGIRTEGFVPVKTEAVVRMPVYYARVGPSDYLLAIDAEGRIYGFSRKGEGRIDFRNKAVADLENLYLWPGNNLDNTKLVYVDGRNNLIQKISLADKKESFKLGDELSGFRSSFDLLNDDKQMDVILYGDGAIHAYDLFSGKLLESYNEQAVYRDAQYVYTDNSQLIMAQDQAGERLDLIDLSGKTAYSIPHVTVPPLVAELYKDGKKYLVTAGGSRINCRRLN